MSLSLMKTDSDVFGVSMPDRRLIHLLAVIVILNVLYLVDHIFQGAFHRRIDE